MARIYTFEKKAVYMITVFDVAKYFLSLVDETSGSFITHLKLQKLCYYAQAWNLAFEKKPMFAENFEAWAHGPVCSELYKEYKVFGFRPIDLSIATKIPDLSTETTEILDEVWKAYGHLDAKYLEKLTHQERPWIEARGNCPPGEFCCNTISNETMRDYYSSLIQ